jgi:hypothetical protein
VALVTKENTEHWTRRRAFAQVRYRSNIQLLPYSLVSLGGIAHPNTPWLLIWHRSRRAEPGVFVWVKTFGRLVPSSRGGVHGRALETAAVVEGDASAHAAEAIKKPSHALGPSGSPRPGTVSRRDPSV